MPILKSPMGIKEYMKVVLKNVKLKRKQNEYLNNFSDSLLKSIKLEMYNF